MIFFLSFFSIAFYEVKFEKLKCLLYYFKRITSRSTFDRNSVVTFTRQALNLIPKFDESNALVCNVEIFQNGCIEDYANALQVESDSLTYRYDTMNIFAVFSYLN